MGERPCPGNDGSSNPNNVVGTLQDNQRHGCGRPVLTTEGLDISARIREANAGIVVPGTRGRGRGVLKASANPEELKRMGKSGREFYDQKYSWERSKSELIKAYQALEARNRNEVLYTLEDILLCVRHLSDSTDGMQRFAIELHLVHGRSSRPIGRWARCT